MRSEGVTDFPDPGPHGFPATTAQLEDSPHFATDYSACKHLLPDGGVTKGQQIAPALLKLAQCMHAHGVPTWPEPNPNASASPYGDLAPNSTVYLPKEAGVNMNSPVVSAALQTCERENPVG
jgi:hypothetical protein